jgi:hypothetical protein
MLLVRVMIGKVKDRRRLAEILRQTPIRDRETGWTCVSWIKAALERIQADNQVLGTSVVDWEAVSKTAMTYCQQKKDERRFNRHGGFDTIKAPTYDVINQMETIP